MRATPRGLLRRAFFPIVILVIAGLFTLQARLEAPARREAAETLVRALLTGGGDIGATDPFVQASIRSAWPDPDRGFELEIVDGDSGPGSDGSATHVAMIRSDGNAVLGLRVRYDRDPSRRAVIGLWHP